MKVLAFFKIPVFRTKLYGKKKMKPIFKILLLIDFR